MEAGWNRRRRPRLRLEALEDRTLLSTYTVDRLTDVGQGSGLTGDLRYCMTQATSGQDTIVFGVTGTINLTQALPNLTKSVALNGPGADLLTVRRDTGGSYRIFTVGGGAAVALSGLTIANGVGPQPLQVGGGIFNDGTLTVGNCTLSGNSAFEGGGGGIYNSASGMLTINNDMLTGNSSGDGLGGAIRNDGAVTLEGATLSKNRAPDGAGIQNTGTLTVNNSVLSSNTGANDGGGIYNLGGALTVNNSTFSGNSAIDNGGGILSTGTLTVSNSTFSGNASDTSGSAIRAGGALVSISASTFTGNKAASGGSGVLSVFGMMVTISNCTITGNSSSVGTLVCGLTGTISNTTISGNSVDGLQAGGGIYNSGTLTINGSTISGNSVNNPDAAGGIFNRGILSVSDSTITGNTNSFAGAGGTTTAGGIADLALSGLDATVLLLNSTLANNTVAMAGQTGSQLVAGHLGSGASKAVVDLRNTILSGDGTRPNIFVFTGGNLVSQGHNLSNDGGGGFLTGTGDLANVDPLLGPLQDNGGPTQTLALLPGSPAVDAGDNTNVPAFDQRGPGFPRIVGGAVDMGAFEVQPGPATHLQLDAPARATSNALFSITASALDVFGHTASGYLGTVTFRSTDTDPSVLLPSDYAFVAGDGGVHVFPNAVRLHTPGTQIITASDTLISSISGSASIVVSLPIFIVTTNLDDGAGSLRQALLDADANPGLDTIRFAIGTGPQTINLASPLPAITQSVLIDGTSQPGYTVVPLIELNGAGAGPGADGLLIMAGESVVRGLVINRFALNGIELQGGGNVVQGNFIGTDVTGTMPLGNGIGVRVSGSDNMIGGMAAGAGNVIAGNLGDGILISNGTANVVAGNFIGMNAAGSMNLGNLGNGVHLLNASGNTIGGTTDGAANIIAYDGADGVLVDAGSRNAIRRNAIFAHTNGLGIELLNSGNTRLPFPVLTLATSDGVSTTVQGLLASTPNTTLALEFFTNQVSNPSGFGEGQQFLGLAMVTTNSHGTASFTLTFASAVPLGQLIAATATDPDNNTSAFSDDASVAGPPVPPPLGPGSQEKGIHPAVPLEPNTASARLPRFGAETASTPTRLAHEALFEAWHAMQSRSGNADLPEALDDLLST